VRLAFAEAVEVGSVEDGDFHVEGGPANCRESPRKIRTIRVDSRDSRAVREDSRCR
jgi:hypothetical protein